MVIHKVGDVANADARKVRIVHISDTHLKHDSFLSSIGCGDILIHSGDFTQFGWKKYFQRRELTPVLQEIDRFFEQLDFKHKIFVAGNHEMAFNGKSQQEIQDQLNNVTYLQDSLIELEGIKIYGSPWTAKKWSSLNRGFTKSMGNLGRCWKKIPDDTDILVTHMPPQGLRDLGNKHLTFLDVFKLDTACSVCGGEHEKFHHWGCTKLRSAVLKRVRPKIHMYGHVHECNGVDMVDGVLFSNAAMAFFDRPNVFDFYIT